MIKQLLLFGLGVVAGSFAATLNNSKPGDHLQMLREQCTTWRELAVDRQQEIQRLESELEQCQNAERSH